MRFVEELRSDVLVVGAGPIGLETAAILMAEGLEVTVLDAGPIGATIARTFPAHTRFFTSPERLELSGCAIDAPWQEKLTGEQYLAYLRQYVATHGIRVHTFTEVVAAQPDERRLFTRTLSGRREVFTAHWLVLATGGTHEPRTLGVPGETLPHVRAHLDDPHRYAGRRVAIVGGRNSAAESALRCYRVGAQVHLVHRGPALHDRVKFWLRPEVVSLLAEGRIVGHIPDEITEITVDGIQLRNGPFVPVDDVITQIGYLQDPQIFHMLGVQVDGPQSAPVFDASTMATAVPGVFVVGTATAGTQDRFGVFIENCHDHGHRVAAAIAGRSAPADRAPRPLPEV